MYKTGELDKMMESFEKSLKESSIYVSGKIDKADKIETSVDGRIQKRYMNNNYYNNGQVNQLFIMFMHGYANGKFVERLGLY